jgi:hypothetical protein
MNQLLRIRKQYRRLPKYAVVCICYGSTICVGGASQFINCCRPLARVQDAFVEGKHDLHSIIVEVRSADKCVRRIYLDDLLIHPSLESLCS